MQKDKLFLDKFFILQFIKVSILQLLFIAISVFYSGGGHGILIPVIIFYGPILILLSPLSMVINSVELQVFIMFLFFLLLFLLFYFKPLKKTVLIKILVFYFIIVGIMIFYQIVNFGMPSNVSFLDKASAIAISLFLSFLFWRIFFQVSIYRQKML